MAHDFESLLDEYLNRIDSEEARQAFLADHPEEAEALLSFGDLLSQVQKLRDVPPRDPVAVAAGRQQFLQQAIEMRQQQEASFGERLAVWWGQITQLSPTVVRGLATAAMALLLVVLSLGGGAWAVSARSLPGDFLYPVKLVREQVELWLTFDNLGKDELEAEIQERRLQETKALLEERRAANVAFQGQVERVSDNVLLIGGVTVTLPINVPAQDVADGSEVKVEGWTQPDGSFIAQKVQLQVPDQVVATPTATPIPPTATSDPTFTSVPPTDTPAPTDTDTPQPTDTWTAVPPTNTNTPDPTSTFTLTATSTATETETPEPTSTVTLTATATVTETPSSTPTEPRIIKLQFEGAVGRISADSWQIGSETVLIDGSTLIDKRGGAAEVGAWARVTAVRHDNGSLRALEIVIERPAERPPEVSEFQGVISAFSDAEWVVGGTAVHIVPSTDISGTPVVGWLAWVRTVRYQTGPLIATNIRVIEPEVVVQFEGVIESISGSQWVVGGRTLMIAGDTSIEGDPQVGHLAEVEAVQKNDGRLVARWIRVHAEQVNEPAMPDPATPTPTEVPPTPTAKPTEQAPPESPKATPPSNEPPEHVPPLPTREHGKLT